MLLTWFLLVANMINAYVVLDGFDLGVCVLHLFLARTEDERRTLIRTIGPVWDGNEVWLLAGGGTLYFAFPLLYASGFSGFYLPLMIVLWLQILCGIGVELRMHLDSPVWCGLVNGCFGIASLLLTVFYGAAPGNVLRGVPLHRGGLLLPDALDRLATRPSARHPAPGRASFVELPVRQIAARYAVGVTPVNRRNTFVKCLWSTNPVRALTSNTLTSSCLSSCLAFSIRRISAYR